MTPSPEQQRLTQALQGDCEERSHWAALRWRYRHSDHAPPICADHVEQLGELWCEHRQTAALATLVSTWGQDVRLLRALALLGTARQRAVLFDALNTSTPRQRQQIVGGLVASGEPDVVEQLLAARLPADLWVYAALREAPPGVVLPTAVQQVVEQASDEHWAAVLEAPAHQVPVLRDLWRARWQTLTGEQVLEVNSAVVARRFAPRAAGLASLEQIVQWLPRLSRTACAPLVREATADLVPLLQQHTRRWLAARPWDAVEASLLPATVTALAARTEPDALLALFDGPVPEALWQRMMEQAPRQALSRLVPYAEHAGTAAVLVRCALVHRVNVPELERWRATVSKAEKREQREQRDYRRLARMAVADGLGRLRNTTKERSKKRR